jgi:glycolate oxidase FAD binding subunit
VDLIHPHTKADVAEALRGANVDGTRLLVVGGRRHIDKGNPTEVEAELWTTQLDRLVAYEPAEMIAVVEAGMRVGDLARTFREANQEWPVDAPAEATVGGVIAAAVSSSRRLRVGAVRDTVIEAEIVTGEGRAVRSGARTVKNVAGYDLHKLVVGSLGTLAVLVQVGLKLRPLPEAAVSTSFSPDGDGLELGTAMLRAVPNAAGVIAAPNRVEIRCEGWADEVRDMTDAVTAMAPGSTDISDGQATVQFGPSWSGERGIIVEAVVPPSRMSELVEGIDYWQALIGVGVVWFRLGAIPERSAGEDAVVERLSEIRARARRLGGVAPVIHGTGGLGDDDVPALEVHRRLKASFDPNGVLAPGRFWGGI